ncbi:MAG: hypothetical protein ACPL06_00630 [Candidatus Anstonellales archaeon]
MAGVLKGQYFSFDAMVATIIFLMTILAFFSYWNALKSSLAEEQGFMEKEAIRISNAVFTPDLSRGGIGMSWSDKRIRPDKLSFAAAKMREVYNSPYDIYIEIRVGYAGAQRWEAGLNPLMKKTERIVKITRVGTGILRSGEEVPVIIDVYLYR